MRNILHRFLSKPTKEINGSNSAFAPENSNSKENQLSCICDQNFDQENDLNDHRARCAQYQEFLELSASDPEIAIKVKGKGVSAVARQLNLSADALRGRMKKMKTYPSSNQSNIKTLGERFETIAPLAKLIIADYKEGLGLGGLSRKYNISGWSVYLALYIGGRADIVPKSVNLKMYDSFIRRRQANEIIAKKDVITPVSLDSNGKNPLEELVMELLHLRETNHQLSQQLSNLQGEQKKLQNKFEEELKRGAKWSASLIQAQELLAKRD